MIQVKGLSKTVDTAEGELAILKGLDLEIKRGESLAIVGASGSGKSTLLGLLAGLDDASSGQIIIDGLDICRLDEEQRAELRARLVGFVFQNFQLLPTFTALENVMLPLELKREKLKREGLKREKSKAERLKKDLTEKNSAEGIKPRAEAYLQKVGLSHRLAHYPKQLSGGEQQRVALARAFASDAKILFADEPTGNLDKKNAQRVADLLFDLNQQEQTTLVLVTHDMHLAKRCQRILWMDEGQLFCQDPDKME